MADHVFMERGTDEVHASLATPYHNNGEYLEDLLHLAELRIVHGSMAERSHREQDTGDDARQLAASGARVDEHRRGIESRLVACGAGAEEFATVRLQRQLELDALDFDTVMMLAAVEINGRLLGHLQSSQGVAPPGLTLFWLYRCVAPPSMSQPAWMARCMSSSSLLARAVIRQANSGSLPISVAPLRLARALVAFLLEQSPDEPDLRGFAGRAAHVAASTLLDGETHLVGVLDEKDATGFCLWLSGDAASTRDLASRVIAAAGRPMRSVELAALAGERPQAMHSRVQAFALQQELDASVGYVAIAQWQPSFRPVLQSLAELCRGPLIVATDEEPHELPSLLGRAIRFRIPALSVADRQRAWTVELARGQRAVPSQEITQLAEDFPLSAPEIADIVASTALRGTSNQPASAGDLRAAALVRQRGRLGKLTQFLPPSFSWDDLVLPSDEIQRLREIASRQRYRQHVLSTWGMAAKLPYGTGTAALFAGPPGTGKTMAASVIASELARELHRVDLSRVVDKYIGETEKNIGRIFDAALQANAILLFDEADSLFGKRTQVQSSNDRYANLETNYLLQRIEEHPGISILTTNSVQSIDDAFARRIQFRIDFPFPDEASRAEIWQRCFAERVPREANIDFASLGAAFELSGGHIKSAVVRAAFSAAEADRPVSMSMLVSAAGVEFDNMGKLVPQFSL